MSILSELIKIPMAYNNPVCSCSPMYSSFGVCVDTSFPGIQSLVLHYNRCTRILWSPFIRFPGEKVTCTSTFDHIAVKTDCLDGILSFYDQDAFLVMCTSFKPVEFFCQTDSGLSEYWIAEQTKDSLILQGYSPRTDIRDPDSHTAIMNGLYVIKGVLSVSENHFFVEPDTSGKIYVAIAASVLNITIEGIQKKITSAPVDLTQALSKVHKWAKQCIGDRLKLPVQEREKEIFLRAISGLLMNLSISPGYLRKHISAFPNRGNYPTQFLWDSAFQNLAYERMNPNIARDSILQLTDNIRPDGKIFQFQSSTWSRPDYSQPALIGWMAVRYLDVVENKDKTFMNKVLAALEANNQWWLQQRMTRFGLIFCEHGLESGQDDSPRFDAGSILAVDMNSYLVNQMYCTAELGRRMGNIKKADKWDTEAEQLAELIVKYLYDPKQNLFFDACARTGERMSLVTPSAFLPLWCEVPLKEVKIKQMINEWLLNPDRLFGKIPFPCVAYDQPCYDPGKWWRGPTWMPIAWIMLEVLKKYGFKKEWKEAALRLYDILMKDGKLHELFNSQTGEGLCSSEQGWTAAIFLCLGQELRNQ